MGLELESSRCDRHFFAMCGAEIDEMVGLILLRREAESWRKEVCKAAGLVTMSDFR